MNDLKTVFVVGAGASVEIGLPTGSRLKDEISSLFNFSKTLSSSQNTVNDILYELSISDGQEYNEYRQACAIISQSMALSRSIDNFIESRAENHRIAVCAKIAIALLISIAEQKSFLFHDQKKGGRYLDFGRKELANTWIVKFFQLLSERATLAEVQRRLSNIQFIIFNYDRCIEHALLHALCIVYCVDRETASNVLRAANFYHPYGVIGPILEHGNENVEYGQQLFASDLKKAVSRIKTFTESIDRRDVPLSNKDFIRDAGRVVFLGFGFHPINMDRLMGRSEGTAKTVMATTCGLSQSNIEEVRERIPPVLNCYVSRFYMEKQLKCSELFDEYSQALGFC